MPHVRLVLALLLPGALVSFVLLRDPTPHFLTRRSRLVSWSEGAPERSCGHTLKLVHLEAASGLEVDLAVKGPAADRDLPEDERDASGAARPLILILGGFGTGRDAVRLVHDTRGTVVAALSYPFRGDPKTRGLAWIGQALAVRSAALDTPPAVMLALDYLLAFAGIDPRRVELVGVSLGAPFVCVAGALDRRVTRVWSIHGAGRPLTLIDANLRAPIPFGPARAAMAGLTYLIVSGPRLAPERWVERIAPRSFVMINAQEDVRIPRAAVRGLYRSAREPKEAHLLEGPHVHPQNAKGIEEIADLVLTRVLAPPPGGS